MKISWKNIENWRSWKTRFFWGGHFEYFESAILNYFLLHFSEKRSPFIWGIIFFCTMDVFSRILEKKLCHLLCTRLYLIWSNYFNSSSFFNNWIILEEWTKMKVICPNYCHLDWVGYDENKKRMSQEILPVK